MKMFPQGLTMLISSELQFFKSNITLFGIASKTIANSLGLTGNYNFWRNSVYDNKYPLTNCLTKRIPSLNQVW